MDIDEENWGDDGLSEEEESLDEYRKGGYHPVQLGDVFDSRYTVVDKLGWGHFSTVWLAHDGKVDSLVALKIQKSAARYSEAAYDEIELLTKVAKYDPKNEKCVVHLLDHFEHKGPNGTHVCMIFEVLGESLLSLVRRSGYRGIPLHAVKNIVGQVLVACDYLHRSLKMIHTDIKPENVLLCCSEEQMAMMMKKAREVLAENERRKIEPQATEIAEEKASPTQSLSKSQKKRLKKKKRKQRKKSESEGGVDVEYSSDGVGDALDDSTSQNASLSKSKENSHSLSGTEEPASKELRPKVVIRTSPQGERSDLCKTKESPMEERPDSSGKSKEKSQSGTEEQLSKDFRSKVSIRTSPKEERPDSSPGGDDDFEKDQAKVLEEQRPKEKHARGLKNEGREIVRRRILPLKVEDYDRLSSVQVKLVDFGNACDSDHRITSTIQTRQYRSPEVILGAHFETSADMWSVATMTFELVTGDYLFEPKADRYGRYTKDDDHLAQFIELLGSYPRSIASNGRYYRDFFNKKGELKHIRNLHPWGIDDVMAEKYHMSKADAKDLASFLLPMLDYSPQKRCRAAECLQGVFFRDVSFAGRHLSWKGSENADRDSRSDFPDAPPPAEKEDDRLAVGQNCFEDSGLEASLGTGRQLDSDSDLELENGL